MQLHGHLIIRGRSNGSKNIYGPNRGNEGISRKD